MAFRANVTRATALLQSDGRLLQPCGIHSPSPVLFSLSFSRGISYSNVLHRDSASYIRAIIRGWRSRFNWFLLYRGVLYGLVCIKTEMYNGGDASRVALFHIFLAAAESSAY